MPTYTNPVVGRDGGADPAVLLHEGRYYFYSTNRDLAVFTSADLVHWTKGPSVLPEAFRGVWAPEVYHHPEDGRFYMYYTLRYKIGVAVADRPDGMFTDLGFLVIDAIDAHPFRDDDGRLYLYFTHTPSFMMYCVPMKSPTQTGGPVTKCFEISQAWEKHDFPINEGPWILKRDGLYYLLYSGSNAQSVYYAVGYATAPTPIGPFTKHPDNPVFQDLGTIHGPGHGSVTRDRMGQLWHLYHQKIDTTKGWARDICLDSLAFDDNGVLGGTPTRGVPRPAPICDPSLVWSPDIRPQGAVFTDRVDVTLASQTKGAEIRYTLDDSEPGADSPLYTRPFTLTSSATVRARAYRDGMTPSTVAVMRFARTDTPRPANPAPDAEPGDPPFVVFPAPTKNWQEAKERWEKTRAAAAADPRRQHQMKPLGNDVKVLFLHHSTGNCVWRGGVPEWFAAYNREHSTNYQITAQAFPKKEPYGWRNYPYDYWNIWVNHAGEAPYMDEPTLEMLTKDYDVIVFKHCFPVSSIEPDTGSPDVADETKRLENYILQYDALKAKLHEFPNTRFVVWTAAALVEAATNEEQAKRTRRFVDWVKTEWNAPGDNIFVWDFHALQTEGGLYLKGEHAAGEKDSHPNEAFSRKAAPLLCEMIVEAIRAN